MADKLLKAIFGHNFSHVKVEDFTAVFFKKELSLVDLYLIHQFVDSCILELGGKIFGAGLLIQPKTEISELPFMLMAQIHGNEPAGLAAILYVLALNEADLLQKPVIAMIGNDLAARQYFEAWNNEPDKRQERRDAYRRGINEEGKLLPDMNRIPNNFRELDASSSHAVKRWQELDFIVGNSSGILDIHSARGKLVCLTESSDNSLLKNSPIRNILTDLIKAIGSATGTITFKTVAAEKKNIKYQFGIEAGTHEDLEAFKMAAQFTASLFYTLGISSVKTAEINSDEFINYQVKEALKFSDLKASQKIGEDEIFYSAKIINADEVKKYDQVITFSDGVFELVPSEKYLGGLVYAIYQYGETETVIANQVVAVSIPGRIELRAPYDFSGIFVTKSAEVYSDPAIGLYPTNDLTTKFCYPCVVTKIKI